MAFQQQHSGLFVVPESPQLPAKRMRTEAVSAHTSTGIGTEMRKLVVSTCRNIAYVECTLDKQQKKLQTLEDCKVSKDCYLVTADVTSLYTNIPIPDCLVAIDMFCRANNVPITALITELSRLVLTNNFFEANGVLFHQVWGLAMGTPLAVSAAVIYMANLEERLLHTKGLVFYKRFIDDIFFVWDGTYIELLDFLRNSTTWLRRLSLPLLSHKRRLFFWTWLWFTRMAVS